VVVLLPGGVIETPAHLVAQNLVGLERELAKAEQFLVADLGGVESFIHFLLETGEPGLEPAELSGETAELSREIVERHT
jgi:hypothetical protein